MPKSDVEKPLLRAVRSFRQVIDPSGEELQNGHSFRAIFTGRLLSQLELALPCASESDKQKLDACKRVFRMEINRSVDDMQVSVLNRLMRIARDVDDAQAVAEIDGFLGTIQGIRTYGRDEVAAAGA